MSVDFSFKDSCNGVKAALEAAILEALQGIGEAAEKHAKAKAPVDTGNLRDHIRHMVVEDDKSVLIGTYDEEVPYALYVEVGTHKMAAQPFLKPAAAEHGSEYRKIIEAALKNNGL